MFKYYDFVSGQITSHLLVLEGHCYAWQYESFFFIINLLKKPYNISCPLLKKFQSSNHQIHRYGQNAHSSISYNYIISDFEEEGQPSSSGL